MPAPLVDQLPSQIIVPSRDTQIAKFKRDFSIRVPSADTGPNTQVDVDARVLTDSLLPVYAAAVMAGQNAVLEASIGNAVDQWADREGVSPRFSAVGGSGAVTVSASVGGTLIVAGDELVDSDTGLKFKAITTALYLDGTPAPIEGVDTGPGTNLPAGTVLTWTSPRPGSAGTAAIAAQADGSGTTGGRDGETDDELVARIKTEKSNRAASGNDAEYQLAAASTPGVPVQQVFTYPAVFGPGTTCVIVTLRPSRPGGSRIPNPTQIALVEANVVGAMPADDGAFFGTLAETEQDVVYQVTWDETATPWQDVAPWPPFYPPGGVSGGPGAIYCNSATGPTSFTLVTDNGVYTSVAQPVVGQTMGFYDPDNGVFQSKRILSFTGTGPWVITVDTTNGVSDTSYTPGVNQRACPWSASLGTILPNLWAAFDALGPGEQVEFFYDEGRRQRRQPQHPRFWPWWLTNKALEGVLDIPEIADGIVQQGALRGPTLGSAGSLSFILRLRYVSLFPE